MRSNSSSAMSKNGVAELMPAPFTTTSTRPERRSTASSSVSNLSFARRFGRMKPRASACRVDSRDPRIGLVLVAADDHGLGACPRKAFGHGAAQLAGAADDHRDPVAKREERRQEFSRVRHRAPYSTFIVAVRDLTRSSTASIHSRNR